MFIIHTNNSAKKRKRKFKSAEEKANYLLAQDSEFGIAHKRKKVFNTVIDPLAPKTPYVRETPKIRSLGNGIGVATKAEEKVYTGTKMIGIGTLHKSNACLLYTSPSPRDS